MPFVIIGGVQRASETDVDLKLVALLSLVPKESPWHLQVFI